MRPDDYQLHPARQPDRCPACGARSRPNDRCDSCGYASSRALWRRETDDRAWTLRVLVTLASPAVVLLASCAGSTKIPALECPRADLVRSSMASRSPATFSVARGGSTPAALDETESHVLAIVDARSTHVPPQPVLYRSLDHGPMPLTIGLHELYASCAAPASDWP